MEGELGPAHGELLETGEESSTLAFITPRVFFFFKDFLPTVFPTGGVTQASHVLRKCWKTESYPHCSSRP